MYNVSPFVDKNVMCVIEMMYFKMLTEVINGL